jgi:predicted CopG family antitoxin
MTSKLKTVKVKPEVYAKLIEQASWNESMSDVISSLLKRAK